MNTYIYLVRHAHSVFSADERGRGLSEKGSTDARRVTDILKNEGIDAVVSSPYKRAVQTVDGIAEHIGVPVITEEDFRERAVDSKPVEDFEDAMNKLWSDETFRFDGGESNRDAQKRGIEAIERILSLYPGRKVVVGTHGNIMVLIMNFFNRRYDYQFWKQLSMPDIFKLNFEDGRFFSAERIFK